MSRTSVSINFTPAALGMLDSKSTSLGLSRSSYLESLIVTDAYKDGYQPTLLELESLNNGFLMNSSSSVSFDFRNQHSYLSPHARFAAIAFFYGLNLLFGASISSQKQANIHKRGELVCYYATGVIGRGRQSVFDYVCSLSNPPYILGPANQPKDEYVFVSCLQQFKIASNYVHFPRLCQLLGTPSSSKVIQIHYSQFDNLLTAIEGI